MGYKIICELQNITIEEDKGSEIPRFTDNKYNGYLANMSPSVFASSFEDLLPIRISGKEFISKYGQHVDPATSVIPDHVYSVRANSKYAVLENYRVNVFYHLLNGCQVNILFN